MSRMTVGELIDELSGYSRNTLVVLASDGEANEVSPLYKATFEWYAAENPWFGSLIADEDLDEYKDGEKDPVVCLHPSN